MEGYTLTLKFFGVYFYSIRRKDQAALGGGGGGGRGTYDKNDKTGISFYNINLPKGTAKLQWGGVNNIFFRV